MFLSKDSGLFLPTLFGAASQEWVGYYTGILAGPLKNSLVHTAFVGVLWGILGFVVYSAIDFVVTTLQEIRQGEKEIQMSAENQIVRHPLRRTLLIRLAWRLALGLLAATLTLALQPVIATLFVRVELVIHAPTLAEAVGQGGIVLAVLLIILHLYIVLLRLFVFRTRVFGEIIR
ncbi:MAG TPA: hypothetical protein VJ836_01395 [Candidatus Saccharimonadales bacterium]|nr:hypothetical protein [Candidatus Saccharimonadales bacterium]